LCKTYARTMAKVPMDPSQFEELLSSLNQETSHARKKLEILFSGKGHFSAEQAAWIIHSIAIPTHRVEAVRMLEPRLCRMTCDEARMILATFTVQNDKLKALDCLKRVLCDCQTQLGTEYILSAFPFEDDKLAALSLLRTVRSDAADLQAAGGHQGYGALGGLYTQARPLVPHLYGPLEVQKKYDAGKRTNRNSSIGYSWCYSVRLYWSSIIRLSSRQILRRNKRVPRCTKFYG